MQYHIQISGDNIKFEGTLSLIKLVKTDFEIKTLSIKVIIIIMLIIIIIKVELVRWFIT